MPRISCRNQVWPGSLETDALQYVDSTTSDRHRWFKQLESSHLTGKPLVYQRHHAAAAQHCRQQRKTLGREQNLTLNAPGAVQQLRVALAKSPLQSPRCYQYCASWASGSSHIRRSGTASLPARSALLTIWLTTIGAKTNPRFTGANF